MRATGLQHRHAPSLPPIYATIVAGEDDVSIRISDQGTVCMILGLHISSPLPGGGLPSNSIESPSDLFSFSYIRNATRMQDSKIGALRSASSRGVKATVAEQVGGVEAQPGKDPEQGAGIAPHQRMGLGLPMSNIFATWVLLSNQGVLHNSQRPVRSLDISAGPCNWCHWMDGVRCDSACFVSGRVMTFRTGTDAFLRLPRLVSGRSELHCM